MAYGDLYLDHMEKIKVLDEQYGGERRSWRLTKDVARYLALAMSYEDTIRVADLKTRDTRFVRVRADIHAEQDQIFHVSEYFHPRIEEICDILPAKLGAAILSGAMKKRLEVFFQKGRRITTTKLPGFLLLSSIAALRFMRRKTYRYGIEEQRIESWLNMICVTVSQNYALACELAALQRLIKGYGETHNRGLKNYENILSVYERVKDLPDPHLLLADLSHAALQDEAGEALDKALQALCVSREVA